jgi:phosphoribosylformylglycinamidine synthase
MKFTAEIEVMPHDNLLDPQGKAVGQGLQQMGFHHISQVRVGKHIRLEVEAESEADAQVAVQEACNKLLANPIMESFSFRLKQA